jgi:hypothetical protein
VGWIHHPKGLGRGRKSIIYLESFQALPANPYGKSGIKIESIWEGNLKL